MIYIGDDTFCKPGAKGILISILRDMFHLPGTLQTMYLQLEEELVTCI